MYDKIYGIFHERIPKPDLAIYLQISLPTLLKRIAREGNALERNISESYLSDVIEAFDYFFFNYQAAPLLVIKADDLNFDSEEDLSDLLKKIKQLERGTLYYVPLSQSNKDAKNRT